VSFSPVDATLVAAADAVARGEISSVELTADCLARADRLNGALNCFVRLDPESALAQARRADAARAAGEPLGALHGVPLAFKDMFYDQGQETSCGSNVRAGFRADTTATVLTRARAAGAIELGALNMTEFALGPTGHNLRFGACHNPWNPEHIAGGSSSGSGAALAARLAFGTVGSDTGGSIRLPAAVNGVLGLKATYGLIPRTGAMGLSWSTDHVGPMARDVADLARLLGVFAGRDPADPASSTRTVPDYTLNLHAGVKGLRIGVPANFFFEEVDTDVGRALALALATLEAAGARLVEITVPTPDHLTELSRTLVYSEATALHGHFQRTCPADYSPQVRARAATGVAIPASIYLEAVLLRPILLRRFVAEVFSGCDVLATPTLPIPVPTLAETDVGASAGMWQTIARMVRCTAPFNYLGLPALSVPAGFVAPGLPVGLQLVGRPFAEATLLRTAAAYQADTDWHLRRPSLS